MRQSLLNFISTPLPMLNSLGLNLRVGLSSEDPMVGRRPSEEYETYLSIYSPEGTLLKRPYLGAIPPHRRKYFDVSEISRSLIPQLDHLTVVHRIPTRLSGLVSNLEDEIELPDELDSSYMRSLAEYSLPEGGNGSVIYETPPHLNTGSSSNTLTFTNQIVLSEFMNTSVVLINHSVNSKYAQIADYTFAVYSLSGELVVSDHINIGPFGVAVLDMSEVIPKAVANSERDIIDGLSTFTFVGLSDDAVLLVMVVNSAPGLGAVSVEHTHPPQTYMFPFDSAQQRLVKSTARARWKSVLSAWSRR